MAVLNEFMLSGVNVKPRSIKAECGVKKPHHTRPWLASSTIAPYVELLMIHGTRLTTPSNQKPQ